MVYLLAPLVQTPHHTRSEYSYALAKSRVGSKRPWFAHHRGSILESTELRELECDLATRNRIQDHHSAPRPQCGRGAGGWGQI